MAAATPQTLLEIILGGILDEESEFQNGLTAACGPNIIADAARWASQRVNYLTYTMYQKMRSYGQGGTNGAATPTALALTMQKLLYKVIYPNKGETISAFMRRMVGYAYLVVEVSNGQALRDYRSGTTEDASGLQYHYIGGVGRNYGGVSKRDGGKVLPAGWWFEDGDSTVENPIIAARRVHRSRNTDLLYYPDAVLAAARPCAVFAVAAAVPLSPLMTYSGGITLLELSDPEVARYFAASGADWHCTTTGKTIKAGPFLDYYRSMPGGDYNGLSMLGLPLDDQFAAEGYTGVALQPYELQGLADDPAHVLDHRPGITGRVYPVHLDKGPMAAWYAKAAVAAATAPLEAQVKTLQGQTVTPADRALLTAMKTNAPAIKALATAISGQGVN